SPVAFLFADHRDEPWGFIPHQIARFSLDRLQADETHHSVVLGVETRLFGNPRSGTADVEGTHRELRSGLADGLGRDHASGFTQLDQTSRRQVAAVAHDANPALGLAGEHGADLYPLDARGLNRPSELLGDLVVDIHDDVAIVVFNLFERHAAHDAVAQRLDNFPRFDDAPHEDATDGAPTVLG